MNTKRANKVAKKNNPHKDSTDMELTNKPIDSLCNETLSITNLIDISPELRCITGLFEEDEVEIDDYSEDEEEYLEEFDDEDIIDEEDIVFEEDDSEDEENKIEIDDNFDFRRCAFEDEEDIICEEDDFEDECIILIEDADEEDNLFDYEEDENIIFVEDTDEEEEIIYTEEEYDNSDSNYLLINQHNISPEDVSKMIQYLQNLGYAVTKETVESYLIGNKIYPDSYLTEDTDKEYKIYESITRHICENTECDIKILQVLAKHISSGNNGKINLNISNFGGMKDFVQELVNIGALINYKEVKQGKYDILATCNLGIKEYVKQYLTGTWLEHCVYMLVNDAINKKGIGDVVKNLKTNLTENDVVAVYKGVLYYIECKTGKFTMTTYAERGKYFGTNKDSLFIVTPRGYDGTYVDRFGDMTILSLSEFKLVIEDIFKD